MRVQVAWSSALPEKREGVQTEFGPVGWLSCCYDVPVWSARCLEMGLVRNSAKYQETIAERSSIQWDGCGCCVRGADFLPLIMGASEKKNLERVGRRLVCLPFPKFSSPTPPPPPSSPHPDAPFPDAPGPPKQARSFGNLFFGPGLQNGRGHSGTYSFGAIFLDAYELQASEAVAGAPIRSLSNAPLPAKKTLKNEMFRKCAP